MFKYLLQLNAYRYLVRKLFLILKAAAVFCMNIHVWLGRGGDGARVPVQQHGDGAGAGDIQGGHQGAGQGLQWNQKLFTLPSRTCWEVSQDFCFVVGCSNLSMRFNCIEQWSFPIGKAYFERCQIRTLARCPSNLVPTTIEPHFVQAT